MRPPGISSPGASERRPSPIARWWSGFARWTLLENLLLFVLRTRSVRLVCDLYGLSDEDIAIIRDAT
jgi:hypothetical protein